MLNAINDARLWSSRALTAEKQAFFDHLPVSLERTYGHFQYPVKSRYFFLVTMTTAVNNSSSATVYLQSGQHYPRFFSLTTDESTLKAMQPSQRQLPTPVSTSSAWIQPRAPVSSAPALPAQQSMPWLASTRPALAISLQPRSLTDRNAETESALSPLSQRSRQSPESRIFSSRRYSKSSWNSFH